MYYLRKKEKFIFNATNLIQLNRQKLIKIFTDYHAKVKIIFLETAWDENILRNKRANKANINKFKKYSIEYIYLCLLLLKL